MKLFPHHAAVVAAMAAVLVNGAVGSSSLRWMPRGRHARTMGESDGMGMGMGRPEYCVSAGDSCQPTPECFPLGVASGEPEADGFVLWTHVNPSCVGRTITVHITDSNGVNVVSTDVEPDARRSNTIHYVATGLTSGVYTYRFTADGESSDVGSTRTTFSTGDDFAVAWTSCSQYESGYFKT